MTETATLNPTISEYADAVRAALCDLPPHQVQAVLEGLDDHLSEIAADGNEELEAALGTPEAYAAELRASAGFGVKSADFMGAGPLPTSPATEIPMTKQPFLGKHRQSIARAVTVALLSLLAIVVIRISFPLNGIQIVVACFVAALSGWVLRRIARRADFPPVIATRLPLVVAAVALVVAVLIGGSLAGRRVVYRPSPIGMMPPTTINDRQGRPDIGRQVPNLTGQTYENVVPMLEALGLRGVRADAGGNGGIYVVGMDPAPGTLLPFDSTVMLTTGPLPGPTLAPFVPNPVSSTLATVVESVPSSPVSTTPTAPTTTTAPTPTTVVLPR
jgi:PASTA domain